MNTPYVMKLKNALLVSFALMLAGGAVLAAAEKRQPGPNGGLLLKTEPRAEFFVNKDRKIEITFLDAELEPVPLEQRNVRVTAMAPSGRKILEFDRKENVFISKDPLPDGDGYTVVAQIWQKADDRPENFRIVYEDYVCGGCDLVEYACICDD